MRLPKRIVAGQATIHHNGRKWTVKRTFGGTPTEPRSLAGAAVFIRFEASTGLLWLYEDSAGRYLAGIATRQRSVFGMESDACD